MCIRRIAGAATMSALVCAGSAWGGAQNLKYRLVVVDLSITDLEAANVPGRSIGVAKSTGIAVFEDGRIAKKDFVRWYDGTEASGDVTGYSTYTFENGDSLNLKFTGGWTPEGEGGDYVVLSGTGAFEGATGTGRFDGVQEAWEDADLLEGSFTLDVPAS
jgi:hypothetical protein